jgi:hypothetical protein
VPLSSAGWGGAFDQYFSDGTPRSVGVRRGLVVVIGTLAVVRGLDFGLG